MSDPYAWMYRGEIPDKCECGYYMAMERVDIPIDRYADVYQREDKRYIVYCPKCRVTKKVITNLVWESYCRRFESYLYQVERYE